MSAPVTFLRVSPNICGGVERPKPNVTFPGFVFANAINSETVFAGKSGRTTRTWFHSRDGRDRSETLDRVVAWICGEAKIVSVAEQQQRVAVGIGRRHGLGADRLAATRSIFDDHALAETGLHVLGDHPTKRIHRRTGRIGGNDLDGPARIGLSVNVASEPKRKTDAPPALQPQLDFRTLLASIGFFMGDVLSPSCQWDHFSG